MQVSEKYGYTLPKIELHLLLPEVVLVHNWSTQQFDLELKDREVVVDVCCAAAVLRGAHIFAPGVLGMVTGMML